VPVVFAEQATDEGLEFGHVLRADDDVVQRV
jgi:hypothetical protein